jgi:hypothetical protein
MKFLLSIFFLASTMPLAAQGPAKNIIIITTDGLRWQEVYKGMDATIASDKRFNQDDSTYIFSKYWAGTEQERRKKLLPFFWTTIVEKGQLYGNRNFGNKVDNANPYWFSYPGYSEIMTGYADTAINSNAYKPNPHITVLEFFNNQPAFKGKVAAFGAWNAFDRILNEARSGINVVDGFDDCGGANPSAKEKLINEMRSNGHKPWGEEECLDMFTHYAAFETLKTRKPRVLYISYGETDEWAHGGMYKNYLDAAHQFDQWLKDIWTFVQTDPQYKGNTSIFITTDHGRGDIKKEEWTSHGSGVSDSHEIWFAAMGPAIRAAGEIKQPMQIYQQQFAQTFAKLLNTTYTAQHPIAAPVNVLLSR